MTSFENEVIFENTSRLQHVRKCFPNIIPTYHTTSQISSQTTDQKAKITKINAGALITLLFSLYANLFQDNYSFYCYFTGFIEFISHKQMNNISQQFCNS